MSLLSRIFGQKSTPLETVDQIKQVLQEAKQLGHKDPRAAMKHIQRHRNANTFQRMTKLGGRLHDEFRKAVFMIWSHTASNAIIPVLPSVAIVPWQKVKCLQDLFNITQTVDKDIVYLVSSHPEFDADALTQLEFLGKLSDSRVVMVLGRLHDRWLGPVLIRKSFILMAGQMLKPSKKEMLRELFGFAKKRGFIVK
jgi:hypothetical protein